MVEKTNTNNSTLRAVKSSYKKSDDGSWQPRKARYRKGDKYKKATKQSTFISGTEELETNTLTLYGLTMKKDCVNSKDAFIAYAAASENCPRPFLNLFRPF